MLNNLAARLSALTAVIALGACAGDPAPTSPFPPLASDEDEPALALIEHVLNAHFAAQQSPALPTTCVTLSPAGLSAGHEAELILRFPRLAPRGRCETEVPPPSDGFTGDRAVFLQIYDFRCEGGRCTGWLSRNGQPVMHYTMVYEGGFWRTSGEKVAAR